MAEPRGGSSRQSSEFTKRAVSALALIPLAVLVAWWGGFVYFLAVAAVAVVSLWEWTRIAAAGAPAWLFPAGAGALVGCLLALHLGRPGWAALLGGGGALAMILAGVGDAAFRWSGLGVIYAALPSAALLLLRGGDGGLFAILFLAAVVWSGDIAAYFGGRRIGGPRLWPRVSPKKTVSGAVCGFLASIAVGIVAAALAGAGPLLVAAAVAALLGIAGQAGDLLESAVKRQFAVKDSGTLIPGHGGMLDRFDALFAAAFVAALLVLAGAGGPLSALGAGR
ncbi:MAG TPA: phosphatidate cytidylyltransferase [Afifellaceae bacterium]|nr:phosphatidate cytidylyltransferase [Afifellaceae bacterium]